MPVTASDVEAAARNLAGVVKRTPLEISERLSQIAGVPVSLKREDLQVCRSFKARGAYNFIHGLSDAEAARGVVCASAGNHAQGFAYACATRGIKGTVFLPSSTPRQKRQRIATIGGEWVTQTIIPGSFDVASAAAAGQARATGQLYVHPFDAYRTIAGQGTIAIELADQWGTDCHPTVVVPVGGGGLIAGIAVWMKARRPDIRIVGVESEGAASMCAALKAGQPVSLERVDSFVDGTAVGHVGDKTFPLVRDLVDQVVTVPEGAVCTEMLDLYHCEGVIAEPSGALASAAIRLGLVEAGPDGVVAVVSGGNNDLSRYAEVTERSARYEGLRHYFLVTFNQEPGSLRGFLDDVLSDGEDIIHFEYTKKNNRDTGPALVGIELAQASQIDGLRKRMQESPLAVQEIAPDTEVFRVLV